MIHYKDLMIGNWVYENKRSKFPMYVVNVGDGFCYLDFPDNEGDVFDATDKYMMPINVDNALLEKIGFIREYKEHCIPYDDYQMIVNDCHVSIRQDGANSKGRIWSCQIDNDRYESLGGFDFHYLHELQNGIRLITKGDLEIKEL